MMKKPSKNSIGSRRNRQARLQDPELLSVPMRFFIGKSTVIHIHEGDPEKQVQEFFNACREDGTLEQVRALHACGDGLVGLNFCFTEKEYRYAIAAPVKEGTAPCAGLERFCVEEGDFARFHPGAMSCHDAWREIYNNWLPNAPYRYRMAQEMECYGGHGPLFADVLWVPVEGQAPAVQPEERKGRSGLSGGIICAALCAVIGLLFTFEKGYPWLGALLGYAAGRLLFALFKGLHRK